MQQAVNRRVSDILRVISVARANVNFIKYTRKICVKVNSLMIFVQKLNMLRKNRGVICVTRRFEKPSQKLQKATVCPSIRIAQLGFHWTDLNEIWHLSIFRQSVEKIQVSLKPDNNNRYLTWRLFSFMTISPWIILIQRNIFNKSCRENQNTHFIFGSLFPENRAVYEIMSKILVESERPQMAIQYGACVLIAR